ncbi:sigma-70 family RNA polymerase sigma factor [Parabacteroides sp. HGS0025]|uniref:RNA polymerase sigma factor n=1 Tax=Parabacteroides sp. HGS0025 TaxID=1078087 RepID=UPI0006172CFF|nr:sigma-70 family RNA polymerase sigma factor [Parabacteroides sp. HGS0025]KKB46957.1 sigma-70 family RNA polymerase sigma factor [Parabacteroides sp. HGS0025]
MQISDEKLWGLCLTGDREAFKEIYCRFYFLLFNYGSKLVSDKDLVKDCIQDVFIKLIQNSGSLSFSSNVKGYLIKALRNKLYDALEKERLTENITLYEEIFITDELLLLFPFDDSVSDYRVKRLMQVFTQLLPHQQEIIYLYYVNELKHEEIAEIMGINYQSSKNLLFRSLSALRRLYLENN